MARIRKVLNYLFKFFRNGIVYGIHNSAIAYDPRFIFSCFAHQKLPRSTNLPHPTGIVIGGNGNIGENVSIYQNVTVGSRGQDCENYFPEIGDDVIIYSGAKVLGDIDIGNDAIIAANSVVVEDVPEGGIVAGAPAEVVDSR